MISKSTNLNPLIHYIISGRKEYDFSIKDRTYYKILFRCMDTVRTEVIGYYLYIMGRSQKHQFHMFPLSAFIYISFPSLCLCVSIMVQTESELQFTYYYGRIQVTTLKKLQIICFFSSVSILPFLLLLFYFLFQVFCIILI